MSYIEKRTQSGEPLIRTARIHWVLFIWPALFLLIGAILLTSRQLAIGSLFLVLTVLTALYLGIVRASSEFGLTDRRVMIRIGAIRRRLTTIDLDEIDEVVLEQSRLGGFLGYGTLKLRGEGCEERVLWNIADPEGFKAALLEAIPNDPETRSGDSSTAVPTSQPAG